MVSNKNVKLVNSWFIFIFSKLRGTTYPEASVYSSKSRLTLEIAVFFDEAAYKIFSPHLSRDDNKLQDMVLAYMNGVSKLFH